MKTELLISYDLLTILGSLVMAGVGCQTTLELLHIRSSWKGHKNIILGCIAGIVMGGMAIGASTLVSLLGVQLSVTDESPEGDMRYRHLLGTCVVGTATICSILSLGISFGNPNSFNFGFLLVASTVLYAGISFTQYTAIFGIYLSSLPLTKAITVTDVSSFLFTLSALIVGWFGTLSALTVFFWLRKMWKLNWWMRMACGWWMALSLSASKYLSWSGMAFYVDTEKLLNNNVTDRIELISWVNTMGIIGLASLAGVVMYHLRTKRIESKLLQKISVGVVYFNTEGQLLVTNSGVLPMVPVAKEYDVDGANVFSPHCAPFLWLLRASWCWKEVGSLVLSSFGSESFDQTFFAKRLGRRRKVSIFSADKDVAFCQACVHAIKSLSGLMGMVLEEAGLVWEKPILIERPSKVGSIGWCIVLTKQLDGLASDRCVKLGFRWANVDHVLPTLLGKYAHNTELSRVIKETRDFTMIEYHGLQRPLHKGLYITCMVGKPSLEGLKVLVRSDQRHMIPYKQLSHHLYDPNKEDNNIKWLHVLLGEKGKISLRAVYDLALRVSSNNGFDNTSRSTASKVVEFVEPLIKAIPELGSSYLVLPEQYPAEEKRSSTVEGINKQMVSLCHRIQDVSDEVSHGILGGKVTAPSHERVFDVLLFSCTLGLHDPDKTTPRDATSSAGMLNYRFYPLYNFECGHYFMLTPRMYKAAIRHCIAFDLPVKTSVSEYLRQELGMVCPSGYEADQYNDDGNAESPTTYGGRGESRIDQGLKRFYREWKEHRWFYGALCTGSYDVGVDQSAI
jgi:NO-binding membrane sensor protein with MHYT domain